MRVSAVWVYHMLMHSNCVHHSCWGHSMLCTLVFSVCARACAHSCMPSGIFSSMCLPDKEGPKTTSSQQSAPFLVVFVLAGSILHVTNEWGPLECWLLPDFFPSNSQLLALSRKRNFLLFVSSYTCAYLVASSELTSGREHLCLDFGSCGFFFAFL